MWMQETIHIKEQRYINVLFGVNLGSILVAKLSLIKAKLDFIDLLSSKKGMEECTKLLINAKADVNAKYSRGLTPLHDTSVHAWSSHSQSKLVENKMICSTKIDRYQIVIEISSRDSNKAVD